MDDPRSLAIRAASGAGVPHDLAAALSYLQQAAEQGSRPAPRIATVREFISAQTCDWLIRLGAPHLCPAEVFDTGDGDPSAYVGRTNRSAELLLERTDVVLAFVRSRIAALAGVPMAGLEPSQILHYEVGQEFRPHHDFFDPGIPAYAREAAERGQRALTVLIYLNEGYEGGHTEFPHLGRRFKGRKGDALVFWNVREDGAPDWSTLHAGTAPTKGEKWLFSQWIRVRRA